jgi:hypothetical protein
MAIPARPFDKYRTVPRVALWTEKKKNKFGSGQYYPVDQKLNVSQTRHHHIDKKTRNVLRNFVASRKVTWLVRRSLKTSELIVCQGGGGKEEERNN